MFEGEEALVRLRLALHCEGDADAMEQARPRARFGESSQAGGLSTAVVAV